MKVLTERYICKMDYRGEAASLSIDKKVISECNLTKNEVEPRREHTAAKSFQCKVCNRIFNQKNQLTIHKLIHTRERPYKCECGKSFNRRNHLTQHKLTHTAAKPYRCDVCDNSYYIRGRLERHKLTHTSVMFECNECTKKFKRKDSLITHLRLHTGVKQFTCNECGKSFFQSHDLTVHQRIHTGITPYKCEKCCREYSTSSNFHRHKCPLDESAKEASNVMSATQLNERKLQCRNCNKIFSKKSNLNRHKDICKVPSLNDRNGPKTCECGKSYDNYSKLVIHRRSHTTIENKCPKCYKTFSTKSNLRKHIRNYHKDLSEKYSEVVLKSDHSVSDVFEKVISKDKHNLQNETSELIDKNNTRYPASNNNNEPNMTNYSSIKNKLKGPYKCGECSKFFDDPNRLLIHELTHPASKKYKGIRNLSENSIKIIGNSNKPRSHLCHCGKYTVNRRKVKTKCLNCSATIRPKKNLSASNGNCNENQCGNLTLEFTESNAVNVRQEHNMVQEATKDIAPVLTSKHYEHVADYDEHNVQENTSRSDHLEKNKLSHAGNKPYECGKCSKAYAYRTSLNRHKRKGCASLEVNNENISLEENELLHAGFKAYECGQCSKAFVNIKGFTRHLRKGCASRKENNKNITLRGIFKTPTPHVCDCGKSFDNHLQLAIHQKCHAPVEVYKCFECYETFSTQASFTQHNEIFHDGIERTGQASLGEKNNNNAPDNNHDKNERCVYIVDKEENKADTDTYDLCVTNVTGESFPTLNCNTLSSITNFQGHIDNIDRPYMCGCGKSYDDLKKLVIHQRSHTTVNPNICLQRCDEFSSKSSSTNQKRNCQKYTDNVAVSESNSVIASYDDSTVIEIKELKEDTCVSVTHECIEDEIESLNKRQFEDKHVTVTQKNIEYNPVSVTQSNGDTDANNPKDYETEYFSDGGDQSSDEDEYQCSYFNLLKTGNVKHLKSNVKNIPIVKSDPVFKPHESNESVGPIENNAICVVKEFNEDITVSVTQGCKEDNLKIVIQQQNEDDTIAVKPETSENYTATVTQKICKDSFKKGSEHCNGNEIGNVQSEEYNPNHVTVIQSINGDIAAKDTEDNETEHFLGDGDQSNDEDEYRCSLETNNTKRLKSVNVKNIVIVKRDHVFKPHDSNELVGLIDSKCKPVIKEFNNDSSVSVIQQLNEDDIVTAKPETSETYPESVTQALCKHGVENGSEHCNENEIGSGQGEQHNPITVTAANNPEDNETELLLDEHDYTLFNLLKTYTTKRLKSVKPKNISGAKINPVFKLHENNESSLIGSKCISVIKEFNEGSTMSVTQPQNEDDTVTVTHASNDSYNETRTEEIRKDGVANGVEHYDENELENVQGVREEYNPDTATQSITRDTSAIKPEDNETGHFSGRSYQFSDEDENQASCFNLLKTYKAKRLKSVNVKNIPMLKRDPICKSHESNEVGLIENNSIPVIKEFNEDITLSVTQVCNEDKFESVIQQQNEDDTHETNGSHTETVTQEICKNSVENCSEHCNESETGNIQGVDEDYNPVAANDPTDNETEQSSNGGGQSNDKDDGDDDALSNLLKLLVKNSKSLTVKNVATANGDPVFKPHESNESIGLIKENCTSVIKVFNEDITENVMQKLNEDENIESYTEIVTQEIDGSQTATLTQEIRKDGVAHGLEHTSVNETESVPDESDENNDVDVYKWSFFKSLEPETRNSQNPIRPSENTTKPSFNHPSPTELQPHDNILEVSAASDTLSIASASTARPLAGADASGVTAAYRCDECGASGPARALLAHLRAQLSTASVALSRSHQCEICGVEFSSRRRLARHARVHAARYRCLCGLRFTQRRDVVQHLMEELDLAMNGEEV